MDIIGCTINYQPAFTVNITTLEGKPIQITMPHYFYIKTFRLTRSASGRLIWKLFPRSIISVRSNDGNISHSQSQAEEMAKSNGWVILKRQKRKYKANSFHLYKEGDL